MTSRPEAVRLGLITGPIILVATMSARRSP